MNKVEEYADKLNGMEYRDEWQYHDVFKEMKELGLVAVMGASDDLMEYYGAVSDETGIQKTWFDQNGIIENRCLCDDCPNFDESKLKWFVDGNFAPEWSEATHVYLTNIPSAEFYVMEDDELFCIGLVFDLKDCK